jgi:serine/threonine-protein kinase
VIHRDLKPSNILVKRDGTVKLLDFGIAKHLDAGDATADLTRTGFRMMTPAYASPEQIRGDRAGIRTDVYALGVILYELMAGRPPFDLSDCTPAEAFSIILNQEPERPSVVAGRLGSLGPKGRSASKTSWADLDVLCATAMHKDETRRYPTVDSLIRDVDRYFAGEPLDARPDAFGYRLGKLIRRNRTAVVTTALVLATIVALVVFYTVRLTSARNGALAESARAQRIQRFTMSLFQGSDADTDAGPAEDLKVVQIVDRGLREARALDAEPEVQAELYATLGAIYERLGKLDQADTLLQSALAQRRKLFRDDHPAIAESLVALGLLRSDQAQLDEAERLVREGLEMTRRTEPSNHAAIARATTALGQVLENRGDYEQAITVLEQAVALQSGPNASQADLSASLTELANCRFYTGDYESSETLNRRVLEIDRRIYGDRHPHVADDLINLGAIQFNVGRYPEAEAYDRQALAILKNWYGDDHPETASALTLLGRALVAQERYDEAAGMLRGALAIQERVYGPVHPRVASALNELGAVAMRQGRLDDAEATYRRMIDIYREVHGDGHHLVALGMANLASVYLERKEFARAEPVLREVVARYSRAQPVDELNAGIARIKLGRALLGQRRFAEARDESLAGYGIVSAKADPGVKWLRAARADLVKAYEALGEPEKAAPYREKQPAP